MSERHHIAESMDMAEETDFPDCRRPRRSSTSGWLARTSARLSHPLRTVVRMFDVSSSPVAQARSELRQRRAAELDEVYTALAAGVWHGGRFRSPTSWLVFETGESWGQCALTIRLAERVQSMPLVHDCFATGALSETALRLLCDTWTVGCADAFTRDEALLLSWAQRLDPKDLQLVLTTWRAHADSEDDGTG